MFRFAASILVSIVLVHTLDVDSVGRVEIIFFTANLFSFFWINGLKNAMLSGNNKMQSIGSQYYSYFLVVLLYSTVFALGAGLYYYISSQSPDLYIVSLLIGFLFFNAPTFLIDAVLQLEHRYKSIVWYSVITHLLQVVLLVIVAYITRDWTAILFVFVVWAFAKWIYFLIVFKSVWTVRYDWLQLVNIASGSGYLILFALIGGCMEYVDGVLVERFFDESKFAIFRYGAKEFPLSLLLVAAISSSLLPLASTNIENAKLALKKEVNRVIPILFLGSAFLMMISPYIFQWVYSVQFGFSALIFNMYLLILITRILLPQIFIYSRLIKKYLIYIGLIELVINVCLSLLLIPIYGLIGIVIATIVAYFIEKILLLILLRKHLGISITDIISLKSYLIYSIILVASFIISTIVNKDLIWSI